MAENIEEKEEGSKIETAEPKPSVPAEETAEKAPVVAPRPAARPEFRGTGGRDRNERPGGRRGFYEGPNGKEKESGHDQSSRMPRFKRKLCSFCQDKNLLIDYKRPDILERFITDRGKILPRRVTGTCSRHQRIIAREIKKARIIALLPFVEQ